MTVSETSAITVNHPTYSVSKWQNWKVHCYHCYSQRSQTDQDAAVQLETPGSCIFIFLAMSFTRLPFTLTNTWQVFLYKKKKGMAIIPRMAWTKIFSVAQDAFTSFNSEATLL